MTGAYRIPPRASHCAQEGEELEVGMELYSLVFSGEEECQRIDLCLPCWEKYSKENLNEALSYWKGRVPEKKKKDEKPLSPDEKALNVLRNQDKNEEKGVAYVLAHYLERRQQLLLRKDLRKANKKLKFFEIPESGEVLPVEDQELSANDWTLLEQKVLRLLSE